MKKVNSSSRNTEINTLSNQIIATATNANMSDDANLKPILDFITSTNAK